MIVIYFLTVIWFQIIIIIIIQRLEDCIQKRGRRLITATRNNTNDTRTSGTIITRKVGRKTTLWTFQTTNKRHLTRENVDVAKKKKP